MNSLLAFSRRFVPDLPGSTVLCAVSGGADSMCLLSLFLEAREALALRVLCAHFNHRLRGEESDRDEAFVRDWCREREIPFFAGSADVAAAARRSGTGLEETARALRYAFLEETAAARGADYIATAHNAGDNAETFLLNLARGAALKGLGGIPPVRGRLIRPLLGMTRAEIEAYLNARGVPHVEDSTNREDCCARNRLRRHVLPVLRELNPAFEAHVEQTCALLRQDEDCLDGLAEDFLRDHWRNGRLPVTELNALHPAVFARVVRRACDRPLSAEHVDMLSRLCRSGGPHAAADLPGQRVFRAYDALVFSEKTPPPIRPVRLRPGESVRLEQGYRVSCSLPEIVPEVYSSLNTFFFQCENICDNIWVTSRAEGDAVRLLGRGCTKSLKKLFSEARIPPARRASIPVLRDGRGVLAVFGFGADERCAARPGDLALRVEIQQTAAEANV